MKVKPELSVIICTYNRVQTLPECLEKLAVQHFPPERYEIIVVDNRSTDATPEVVRKFFQSHPELRFRYVVETNQGLSFARNRGIREAAGDVVVFIDDDAFARADFLEELAGFFNRYPDAAACGGRIYPRFESKRPEWMSSFLIPLTSSLDRGDRLRLFPARKFPIGANMAVRRDRFDRYGDFNVRLGRSGNRLEGAEEKDLFYRLQQKGEKIYYLPSAIVEHFVPDRRLTFDFFKRQSLGIGYSEKLRARSVSKGEYIKSIGREGVKWGGSLVLSAFYLIRFRPQAAGRLLQFRWYVSRGLMFPTKNNS